MKTLVHLDIRCTSSTSIHHNQQMIICNSYEEAFETLKRWSQVYRERLQLDLYKEAKDWTFGANLSKSSQLMGRVIINPDKINEILLG